MNKYSGYETYRPVEAPFAALLSPLCFVSEGLLAAAAEVRKFFASAFRRWCNEFKIARTVEEMSRLDDRILRDIGVYRDEIYFAARAAVENPGERFRPGWRDQA